MIPRCSSTVARMRSSVRKSWTRTMRMRSLTVASISARAVLPLDSGQPDVEVLVDEHELGVGVLGRVVLERYPVAAQVEQRRAIVRHVGGRRRRSPTVPARRAVSSSDLRTS